MTARVLDIPAYVRSVRDAHVDAPLLVAAGGFGGPSGHERVGVLALDADHPAVLVDAWLPSKDVASLVEALRAAGLHAREGGWDTMYATSHRHAWTNDPRGPFEVWSDTGLLCAVVDGSFRSANARVPVADIASIEPYVSPDWIERGVRLRRRDDTTVIVVRDEDHAPEWDPTYDGLNLLADVWWTHALARALAAAAGDCPVVDCT